MEKAINESNRRQKIQLKYNKKNNITPKSIKKEILDILEREKEESITMEHLVIEEEQKLKNKRLSDKERNELLIKNLNEKMLKLAQNLEFEKAAFLRDHIKEISTTSLQSITRIRFSATRYNVSHRERITS